VLKIFKQRHFKSLKTRVVVLSLVIFLTGMWALVYAAGYLLRTDLGNMLGNHQLSTARIIASDINQELTFRLLALEKVAAGIPADEVGNTATLQKFLGERPLLQNLFNGGYFFVLPDGTATASLPLTSLRAGINYRDRDYIVRALDAGKSSIGRPVVGRALQSPVLTMAVPVRDSAGRIIGALAGITDLAKPNFLNEITDNRYGKTGSYLLVDPQSHIIVMASDRKFIMQPPVAAGITEAVEKDLGHLEGSRFYIDPQGVEQLLSNICIPSAGWCLAVVIPAKDAFAPVYSMQQQLLMIALLLTMISGVAIWWSLRRQLTPLMTAVEEIGARSDFTLPVIPLTVAKNDEVGRLIGAFNHLLDSLAKREAALVENDLHHQSLLKTALNGIWLADSQGRFLEVNDAFCRMSGYEEGELLNMSVSDVIIPGGSGQQPALIEQIWECGEMRFETGHRRKDGTFFNAEISAQYLPVGDGRILAFVQDITERKQAEEVLRLNEARLRSLVEILQFPAESIQGVLDNTLDEIIRLTGSRFGFIYYCHEERRELELCSWSRDVMAACAVIDQKTTYHLDSAGLWGEAARRREPFILNDFHPGNPLRKGYPEGHVELTRFMSVPVLSSGRVVAVVGVANKESDYDEADVLQLTVLMDSVWKYVVTRKSEIELEQERTRAQTYLDTVEAMIVALDVDGVITAINRKGCQILGYHEEELLGKQWFRICIQQPEGMNLLFPYFKHLVTDATESFEYFENCVVTKEGELKLIAWHNALLRDEQGQIIGTLSSGDDITERRKVEAEKLNLEGQLRQSQKMEAIGQLAGGIAHDFNNILQVILGYTTLIEFGIPDDQKENLQEIRSATERASELTSGLLSYSRKQVLKLETFELNRLLSGIKNFIQRVLGEDIELHLEHSPIPLVAVIDRVHLQQVFVNLASNARDAMPAGGKLTIRLEQKAGSAGLTATEAAPLLGPQALITVSDTGTGIPADILANIFEPFFTTKVEGSGTGLGLSIVQGIISQLNGYITCSSEIGAGTAYHIYLPLSGQPVAEETNSVEAAEQAAAASMILLVEDDPEVRKINSNLLKMRGYRVLSAENGSEAVELYTRNRQIDLVMLDAVMPGMNGGETLARLREINPEVKTLVVSGYPREIISGRMVLPEDVEFMSKPVRPQLLYDAVKKLLTGEVTGESHIAQ